MGTDIYVTRNYVRFAEEYILECQFVLPVLYIVFGWQLAAWNIQNIYSTSWQELFGNFSFTVNFYLLLAFVRGFVRFGARNYPTKTFWNTLHLLINLRE